jgi:alpha-amylase/alpha-mannosidase (GH57 family)
LEVQDTADPFHDWNQRITAECYAPNTAARILDSSGSITKIVNNYERMSFNFGPTLLNWLQEKAPRVFEAVLEADRVSQKQRGQGNALAQVYNHIIMPLAPLRDKLTQIRWGIKDFQNRFNRSPVGMWLAETAVDTQTLQCLAQEGIAFTILAPRQAAEVRPGPDQPWQDVSGEKVETRRAYKVNLAQGRQITVFFYDGKISRSIAFEGLLKDGAKFSNRLKEAFDQEPGEAQLVHVATDGESYGHHHRFGEMALAYALESLDADPELELTNYAAFLKQHPPAWEARIVENSSWSCVHGVERWRSDCGCALDPGRGWNQKWRKPLRQAFDDLNQELATIFESRGGELFKDPWAARDDYVEMIPDPEPSRWQSYLERHQLSPLDPRQRIDAARLLECQRWLLFAFTSCAWFFDDISGLETVQNMRFAARALQLGGELGARELEDKLLANLEQARSNVQIQGTGADIWARQVAPAQVGLRRVVAHAAIKGVMGRDPLPEELYCYRLRTLNHQHRQNLGMHLSWGEVEAEHLRIGDPHLIAFAALHAGGHDFIAYVAQGRPGEDLSRMSQEVEQPLRLMEKNSLLKIIEHRIGGQSYALGDLFLEGRRSLALNMLAQAVENSRSAVRALYEANRDTLLFLRSINVPIPEGFSTLASVILTDDLIREINQADPEALSQRLGGLATQVRALGLSLDSPQLRRTLEKSLKQELESLSQDPHQKGSAAKANQILNLAEALAIELNLWEVQNIYFGLLQEHTSLGLPQDVLALGKRLKVAQQEEDFL